MVIARCVLEKNMKEKLFFCSELKTPTEAKNVMAKVEHFFDKENINWANLCGVCTDGAPAMLGSKSGFQTFIKNKVPKQQLLYYTRVRWLSGGNLVAREFELREEITIFLKPAISELEVHFDLNFFSAWHIW